MPFHIRISFWFLGLAAIMPATLWGGPLLGPKASYYEIDPNGSQVFEEKFQGGQRACVIALAVGENVPELNLTVYDPKGRIVGTDLGKRTAVIWYPARDAEFKIEVRSNSSKNTRFYLAVK